MSSDWKKVKLGDLLELIIDHRGKTPKKMGFEDFHSNGYPVLSAKHVKTEGLTNLESMRFANDSLYKKWMKDEVQEGDVILTSEAPLGELYYISGDEKYLLGQRVFGLRPKKNLIHPLYLFSWLASKKGQEELHKKATGSTVQGIKQSELLKIEVDVPPYNIQCHIAEIHFSLTEKIKSNKQIKKNLEKMAQALFKSWFVDFEPVKAKIAVLEAGGSQEDATFAAMTVISGKDADALAVFERENPEQYAELKATAELFPSAMQESELGDIPEGWDIKNIKSLSIALSKGTTPAKKDLRLGENKNINFLKVKDIGDDGKINFSNLDKISKRVHEMVLKRSVLQSNDILFSIAGTIGRVAVVASDMLACNCNQAIAFIRLKNYASHLNLVRLNLHSPRIQQEVESKVVQGVQANLSLTALGELDIVLPSDCVLIAFNNVITQMWEQKLSITKSIMLLTQLRDTLLPKLLSGEIILPEAEQTVSEAENV